MHDLNDVQIEIINQLKKFRLESIEPSAREDDLNQEFKKDIYLKLGTFGIAGIGINEEFGGLELGIYNLVIALQEIAKSSVSYAVTLSVSNMVQGMIDKYGTTEQKRIFLPELTSGREIASFALSESEAGSDAISLKTKATSTVNKDGIDGYLLNGRKMWITSAGISKTYLVLARTSDDKKHGISAFLVQKDTDGFLLGKKEEKMGWRVSPTRELIFENCFIPKNHLLGKIGDGFKIAMTALAKGRITIGAISCGLAERALNEALKYSIQRKQFNKAIFDFQGIQFMLSDMACEIMASKLLVKEAALTYDKNQDCTQLGSMAKMKSSDTAMKVTTDAVQILGGVGYTSEFPLERFMRDAKVLQIVEGTNQIQKIVIARTLKKEITK